MIPGVVAAAGVFAAGGGEEPPPDYSGVLGTTLLYTGIGAELGVTGAGFSPDLAIIKNRAGGGSYWLDSVRGVANHINSASITTPTTDAAGVLSFDADGLTLGTSGAFNTSGQDYAAFVLTETPGAFDIVSYSGNSNTLDPTAAPKAHGLGVVPELIIVACSSHSRNWIVYAAPLAVPDQQYLMLNGSGTPSSSTEMWADTPPTASEFYVGPGLANVNLNGNTYVAYLFASAAGKTKVGSYSGTGASGNAIVCGFRPRFVLIRRIDAAGDWLLFDEIRDTTAPQTATLELNTADAENPAGGSLTFSETGFEPGDPNVSGATYLYLAVA